MESPKLKNELIWPLDDVVHGKWNQSYKISDNAPFYFKFNDNQKIIQKIQNKLKTSQEYKELFKHQLKFSKDIKQTKVWIQQGEKILPMNLEDVYNAFTIFLKNGDYEDQLFNTSDVSFIGPMGPFKSIALIQCLNEELIEKFIFSYLVSNKLPLRKLRIHTEGNIKLQCGNDLNINTMVNIKQITDSGILFSSHEDLLLEALSQGEIAKFYIDTRSLKEFMGNEFICETDKGNNFFYTDDELRYFFIEEKNIVKTLSYKSAETNEVFLFCRYPHMLESDVSRIFMEFTSKLKAYFDEII